MDTTIDEQTKYEIKNFRNFLQDLNPAFLLESDEVILSNSEMLEDIFNILEYMTEIEVDFFGAFLAFEFFDYTEEELSEEYFDVEYVKDMIIELGEENYDIILELLLPDEFEDDLEKYETDYIEIPHWEEVEDLSVNEGVSRIMKVSNINRKKRKFFTKTKAVLRRERAERLKQNRLTKAKRRSYRRTNKAKLQNYQKSRKTFIKKGRHFVKLRRKGGTVAL